MLGFGAKTGAWGRVVVGCAGEASEAAGAVAGGQCGGMSERSNSCTLASWVFTKDISCKTSDCLGDEVELFVEGSG